MHVQRAALLSVRFAISRGQLMAGLFIFMSTGGLLPRVIRSVSSEAWNDGVFNTFNTSIIVWGAWASACYLALSADDRGRIRPLDIAVACGTFAIAALPATPLSWVALSLLSAYVYLTSPRKTPLRRSAIIFFAICVPLLWGPAMLRLAAPLLLKVDAFLVATLTGAERTGNVVKFIVSGDAGTFIGIQIWPGCSSLSNISHAALAWVALTQTLGRDLETSDVFWCGLAMILAGAVNLARLSAMAVSPEYYTIFHGPLGEQIAGALTIFLIAVVCIFGQRRELFARV
jgi:hypothetical protein